MVSQSPIEPPPPSSEPKPLHGVGIVIAENGTSLGVLFSPSLFKLEELIKAIHGQAITFNLANVRGGAITLEHPPK